MNITTLKGLNIPDSFPEWWSGTKEGKRAIDEAKETNVAERKRLTAESERIEAERRKAIISPEKTVTDAADEFEKATQKLAEAGGALQQARAALQSINTQADAAIASIEATLRGDADPELSEVVSEVRGQWDKERGSWATAHAGDLESAGQRMKQLADLQERVEALQLEVDPEVAAHGLERLKSELAGAPA